MSETRRPNDIDGEEGVSPAFSRRAMLLGGTALAASTMGPASGAQAQAPAPQPAPAARADP